MQDKVTRQCGIPDTNIVPLGAKALLTLAFSACENGQYGAVAEASHLLPLQLDDFESLSASAGLRIESAFGGLDGSSFVPETSPDLVLILGKT